MDVIYFLYANINKIKNIMKTKIFMLICMLTLVPVTRVLAGTWGKEVETKAINPNEGPVSITYNHKMGAVWTGGTQNTTVSNYIKNKIGAYKAVPKTIDNYGYFRKPLNNSKHFYYKVVHIYENKKYTSGNSWFTVRIYKGTYVKIGY